MRVECPYDALSDGVERFVSPLREHMSCDQNGSVCGDMELLRILNRNAIADQVSNINRQRKWSNGTLSAKDAIDLNL